MHRHLLKTLPHAITELTVIPPPALRVDLVQRVQSDRQPRQVRLRVVPVRGIEAAVRSTVRARGTEDRCRGERQRIEYRRREGRRGQGRDRREGRGRGGPGEERRRRGRGGDGGREVSG